MKASKTFAKGAICALALGATTVPASACISSGPGGFGSGMIWKSQPENRPSGTVVLNVEYVRSIPQSWGFIAYVRNGPPAMVGRSYRFAGEVMTSCAGRGREMGFIVVRRYAVSRQSFDGRSRQFYLSAISYQESWLNWFIRFFSNDSWHYPGESVDWQPFVSPSGIKK